MLIIDAHQHFWRRERGDYDWLTPDLEALYRDFEPVDLMPLLDKCKVDGTVLVQAAASETETRYMLDLARDNPFVLGVVGWIDMAAPGAAKRLDALLEYGGGKLKGVRPMVQDISDPDWLLRDELDSAFQAIIDRDLTFDALVRPVHLDRLAERVSRHDGLKVVIDHAAKPAIEAQEFAEWAERLSALAENKSVYCKISGLLTEAGTEWRHSNIERYVGQVIGEFGAGRVMWGSDWPVVNLISDYEEWFEVSQNLLGQLNDRDRANIFGRVAKDFYGLVC